MLISEFDILSDILGVTTLIHDINHGKPSGATEPALLGPFFKESAHEGMELYIPVHRKEL